MKSARFLIVAVCAVITAGCAIVDDDSGRGRGGPFVRFTVAQPRVAVLMGSDGPYVVVDQEPILIRQSDNLEALTTVVWSLDPAGPYIFSKFEERFPGIQFLASGLREKCRRATDDPRKYVCVYPKGPKVKVQYKITITINDSGNERDYLRSDPTMVNN